MSMQVRLTGIPELQRRIGAVADTPRSILKEIQEKAIATAKANTPVRTGKTQRSIRSGGLSSTKAVIKASGAAVYLEFGTRPHIIVPRNRIFLAFPATAAGYTSRGRVRMAAYNGRVNAGGLRIIGRHRSASTGRLRPSGAFSGPMVFTQMVHHPGQQATPIIVPAAQAAINDVGPERIIDAWNNAGRRL